MTAVSQREREAIGERTRDTLNQITAGGGVACGIRTAVAAGHGQRSVAWTWERPIDQHTMEIFWVRVQRTVHLRRVLPHFSFSTNLAASWAKSSQPIDNNVVVEIRSTEPPAIYIGLPIAKYVSAGDLLLRGWFALRRS